MRAVWMRARNELRTRWRAVVSLALIAGIGGGAAIAAVAGARRAETVYPRFTAATHAYDDVIGINGDNVPTAEQFAALKVVPGLPAVAEWSLLDTFNCTVTGPSGFSEVFPDIFPIASPDGRIGTTVNRVKLSSGRLPNPARADEGVLSENKAQHLGARVGSTLSLRFADVERKVRVVGIGIAAGEIDPAAGGYIPLLLLTPAFFKQNQVPEHSEGPVIVVTIRGGLAGLGELNKELERASDELRSTVAPMSQVAAVRRTARFQAVGLVIFAGLAVLTVLAIFGQLLARQIFLESEEDGSLRALGLSSRQLLMLSLLRVAVVALGAAAVAAAVAIALSPLFPIGFMRQLEVSPGFRADGVALAIGAAATFLLVLLAGSWPARRESRMAGRGQRTRAPGSTRAANMLAEAAFPPSAVAGVGMALEPGRGATSVPVRTTIFGSVLALTAFTAALGFGASLHTLVGTPRLSGWNFDVIFAGDTKAQADQVARRLAADGTARSFASGDLPDLGIGKKIINALEFKPGSFGPSIVGGRRPEGSTEIALGPKLMRTLHTAIGKTVVVQLLDPNTDTPLGAHVRLRIVGTVATPQFFFTQEGGGNVAVITRDFLIANGASESILDSALFIRLAPGVSVDRGVERIKAAGPPGAFVLRRSESSDLANLDGISGLPGVGAGLLALVAAATLVHTLVTSVRRRRRDFAILRALGFVPRQVGFTVAWQATTIIVIALVIGLPLGVIAGRLGWLVFVSQLGYVPLPIVPLVQVLLMIPIAIVLANVIASIPARAAARTLPAVALRAE